MKRILYLSDYELLAFRVKGKILTKVQRFQTTADAEFVNYLTDDPKTPIYWLIDSTQEEYQTALLPHVFGKDRSDIIAHRKKRLFENTIYTYGIIQGRETKGRKDDQMLFTALNKPDLLQPWLDLIITHKVPLVGIYSLPLLSQRLLKHLPKAPYTLLVAHTPQISPHNPAGLRQSFFVKQKLQFSRLIPLNTHNPQEYADYVLKQIVTTQHFLTNSRMLPQTEPAPLSTIILSEGGLLEALNQSLSGSFSDLNIRILDNHDFARRLGLRTGEIAKRKGEKEEKALYLCDFVAFQLSRSWYTKNHYAKVADIRYFLYRHLRMGLYFISVLLLVGAGITSLTIYKSVAAIEQNGQKVIEKKRQREVELKELYQKVPQLPIDIVLLRTIVDSGDYLKAYHILPRPALEKLSQVLNRHQNLFLQRLEWGIGNSPLKIFQPYSKSTKTKKGKVVTEPNNPVDEIDPTKNFVEGMRLHGKIHPFRGDYLKALRTFNKFVADLRQPRNDFWQINVLLSPYDSTQKFQGQIGSQSEIGKAPFVIDILIKHSHAKKN